MYQHNQAIRDEILKSYIEQIFNRYDTQGQGTLGPNDITNFFNDLFKSLNINMTLTPQHSYEAVKLVYPNFSTVITREQLFMVFKAMLGMYLYLTQTQSTTSISITISNLRSECDEQSKLYESSNVLQSKYLIQYSRHATRTKLRNGPKYDATDPSYAT